MEKVVGYYTDTNGQDVRVVEHTYCPEEDCVCGVSDCYEKLDMTIHGPNMLLFFCVEHGKQAIAEHNFQKKDDEG